MSDLLKRGNMLWESHRMFLPEHKQALLHYKEEIKKVEKPTLDEQELEEIQIIVLNSLRYELDIIINYWDDGFYKKVTGCVDFIDLQLKRIRLIIEEDELYIPFDHLKSVERT